LPAQRLTRLRANHFRATQLNPLIRKAGVEGLLNERGNILASAWQLRDANQDFSFIAKVLHDGLAEPQRAQDVAHQPQFHGWLKRNCSCVPPRKSMPRLSPPRRRIDPIPASITNSDNTRKNLALPTKSIWSPEGINSNILPAQCVSSLGLRCFQDHDRFYQVGSTLLLD
jgi:hypothetical protein